MSQFPISSEEGLYEAVNYLASGPAGLGQNFSGFSAYKPAYLTGTFREPFTVATTATTNPPQWYVAPVSISAVNQLNVVDGKTSTLEWIFSTPQASPPFAVGQTARGVGWDPGFYDGNNGFVVSCSTTSVITQLNTAYVWPTPINTYGTLSFNNDGVRTSTDANARVTVTGPTEQVFISSQLAWQAGYSCTTTSTIEISVQVNRYVGSVDTANIGAVDYLFDLDETVSEQVQTFTVEPGSGTINTGQNIFTTVIDQPNFGYYWYICEVYQYTTSGDAIPGTQTVGLRSLTAQVIKR